MDTHAAHIKDEIRESGKLSEELEKEIDSVIEQVKKEYSYS